MLGELLLDRMRVRARAAATGRPPELDEGRRWLAQAIERDPGSFRALLSYAGTFFGESGPEPGIEAVTKARKLRPRDLDAARLSACLLARAGKPAAAAAIVESSIAPRSRDVARAASTCIARGAADAAVERVQAEDHAGAQRLVDEALSVTSDPEARKLLESIGGVASSGGSILSGGGDTPSDPDRNARVDAYNEAVALARENKLPEAATRFEALAKDCDDPLCVKAREYAAQMRRSLVRKGWVDSYNRAIALIRDGKHKDAIVILRRLEGEVDDPELRTRVKDLLKELGQKPAP
jgi:hypothetical protein